MSRPYAVISGSYLFFQQVNDKNRLTSRAVLALYSHETDLNAGRFAHYSQEPQETHVVLRYPKTGGYHLAWDRQRIEWIAEQSETPWSLVVWSDTEDYFLYDFSFADEVIAVLFALIWR